MCIPDIVSKRYAGCSMVPNGIHAMDFLSWSITVMGEDARGRVRQRFAREEDVADLGAELGSVDASS